MKTYIRSLTAAAAVAMALGTAPALSAQTLDAVATIPFAFTAGNTTLPRGTYNVSTLPNHTDVLLIRGLETGLILLSQPAGAGVDRSAGLVFDHFENRISCARSGSAAAPGSRSRSRPARTPPRNVFPAARRRKRLSSGQRSKRLKR